MIMNVKITCFPTLTQRRELCALSHNAAQFREELFDAMIHHPQRIEDAPLPEAYQSLPTAMLQQVWKQAQRMKAGSKRDQYRIRRTLPSCQWKRTEMEVRENQLVLDSITQPVYYIAASRPTTFDEAGRSGENYVKGSGGSMGSRALSVDRRK